ncbi:hypothetical protein C0033_09500 [Clostridium sp. chh4-2]|uniref:hypothetical protein n=1 Tax=Clostridium sp. chh4-2 TaxID=2067550 RepID=UPI000CCECECA|nr:hypothetical protein [Clostridium sp. chh4-2]PNV62333.1 hypothetical protein C0033_09500 [Clostridium sp. chh4-2]
MAQGFSVKTGGMEDTKTSFFNFISSITDISSDIESVKGNLGISAISVDRVQRNLKIVLNNCGRLQNNMAQMSDKLEVIINLYSSAESDILGKTKVTAKLPNTEDPGNNNNFIYNYYQDVDPDIWDYAADYFMDAAEQVILGNFTDECNMLGIVGAVLVGCVPYLGTACDIRDLLADIYHLFEDGPETAEWISLGIDVIAVVPLFDLLKYSDELGEILKHSDGALGGMIDYARGTWKYADDVFTKLDDVIQEGAEWTSKNITKIADYINSEPLAQKACKSVSKLYQLAQKEIGTSTGGEIVKDIVLERIKLKDQLVNKAAKTVDSVIDFFTGDSETPAYVSQ